MVWLVGILHNICNEASCLDYERKNISYVFMACECSCIHLSFFKKLNMVGVRKAYRKAVKVIDSCENLVQIESARRYINNFFKVYSTESRSDWGNFQVRVADDLLVKKYNKLYEKLDDKQIYLTP